MNKITDAEYEAIKPQTNANEVESNQHFENNRELYAMIPTDHLVRELSRREGVVVDDADDEEIHIIYSDVLLGRLVDKLNGPAKILVVKE